MMSSVVEPNLIIPYLAPRDTRSPLEMGQTMRLAIAPETCRTPIVI